MNKVLLGCQQTTFVSSLLIHELRGVLGVQSECEWRDAAKIRADHIGLETNKSSNLVKGGVFPIKNMGCNNKEP